MATLYGLWLYLIVILICCGIEGKPLDGGVLFEGYYWRDYTGEIPHDAIPGGPDANGETMYIGQTVFRGIGEAVFVPGQINATSKTLMFEWGRVEQTTSKNIKILCSEHPERLEWLRTTREEIKRLDSNSLVLGGHEGEYTVYIGRLLLNGQLTISKVNVVNGKALLHATKDGKEDYHQKFEILNYNRHIPDISKIVQSVEKKLGARNSAGRTITSWSVVALITCLLFWF